MANKNGHWYTDKNGNHYFVENGQTPQEGWEASKRRKMIDGGKYKVSEDGNDWRDVEKDEYDKFESDNASFDDNVDDDFGFDEDDDFDTDFTSDEEDAIERYSERYGVSVGKIKKAIYDKAQEYMKGDNMGDEEAYDKAFEEVFDEVAEGEFNKEEYDESDFRSGYKNHLNMSEEDFKNKYRPYEKGKGGYEPYSSGENKGYTVSDKNGTTIGYYDLNDNKLHYEDAIKDYEKKLQQDYKTRIKNARDRYIEKVDKLPFGSNLDEERRRKAEEIAKEGGWNYPNHYAYLDGMTAYEEGEFNDDDLKNYLTEQYGERKAEPTNIGDKVGKVGDKELKLSEIAEKITKYGDTDLQGLMIPILASAYGLSEAEVDKYLTDTYFATHDHNGNTKAMNNPKEPVYTMKGNKPNPEIIYKDWKDMTPEEQKTTKMQAKNVFDYLQERLYNKNLKDNEPLEPKINALKGFLSGKEIDEEGFKDILNILERYVK